MTGPYFDLVEKYKMKMIDLDHDSSDLTAYPFDIVQVKMDGWWTLLDINNYNVKVITSGGEVRMEFGQRVIKKGRILAEWMYGTNWAQTCGLTGFLAHDILDWDKFIRIEDEAKELYEFPYYSRQFILENIAELFSKEDIPITGIRTFPVSEWENVWNDYVVNLGYEGLVFKNSNDPFPMKMGRMKPVVEEDFVIMGYNEGTNRLTGTLGSIVGGMYVDGVLTRICTVGGGFDDALRDEIWTSRKKYIGRVFTARGKLRFSSGALRHPAFWCWRDDKDPRMCKR